MSREDECPLGIECVLIYLWNVCSCRPHFNGRKSGGMIPPASPHLHPLLPFRCLCATHAGTRTGQTQSCEVFVRCCPRGVCGVFRCACQVLAALRITPKRDLVQRQKRPSAKYIKNLRMLRAFRIMRIFGKRDLVWCQKRPSVASKET